MIYENGIAAFREEQRQQAIEKHDRNLQLDKEQKERTAAEEEAAKPPQHEEMKEQLLKAKADLWKLQPGDIYAVSTIKRALLESLSVLQYVFDTMPQDQKQNEE